MNNETTFKPLIESSIQICNQMQNIINQCEPEVYDKKITMLSNATIGQHFRHIIEFYIELFNGIPLKTVNYENRQRDLLIETLPSYAVSKLQEVITSFDSLNFGSEISLTTHFSANEGEDNVVLETSVARELFFTFEHAIHHLAIINIALKTEFSHIELPKNLGIAPSTIRYREECAR